MRSRSVRALSIAAALLVPAALHPTAGAQGPCEPGGTGQAEPFVACGRTTVVGPRGSTMRLHVPHETVLDLSTQGSPETFRNTVLKGDGPVQGFLLTDNALPSDGGKYVYAVHLVRGFFRSVQDYATGNFEQRAEGQFVIPPGDYSLYVISDGNPVTATLPFEGQPGVATYEPSRVVLLDFRVLSSRWGPSRPIRDRWLVLVPRPSPERGHGLPAGVSQHPLGEHPVGGDGGSRVLSRHRGAGLQLGVHGPRRPGLGMVAAQPHADPARGRAQLLLRVRPGVHVWLLGKPGQREAAARAAAFIN
jgi:hypothetical protein